jgi:hypothetical protein
MHGTVIHPPKDPQRSVYADQKFLVVRGGDRSADLPVSLGFAGPGESTADYLTRLYDVLCA